MLGFFFFLMISFPSWRLFVTCCAMLGHSDVSDSLQPHGLEATRLLWPWGFSRREYWSGLPCPPPGHLPNPGIEPRSPTLQVDSLPAELPGKPCLWHIQFSSVQSLSHVQLCDPMNHSTPGLPVHHQLPEFTQTHVHRIGDTIQPSHPLSSPSPPAPNPSQHECFPMSQLFTWDGQSTGVWALASFLPKNTQDWSPLEWTGWISLQSKELSGVFSNTTVQKHQFFGAQLSSQSNKLIILIYNF